MINGHLFGLEYTGMIILANRIYSIVKRYLNIYLHLQMNIITIANRFYDKNNNIFFATIFYITNEHTHCTFHKRSVQTGV